MYALNYLTIILHQQCEAFEELIEGSSFLTCGQVRTFAAALVHNKLGVLSVHSGQRVEEQVVVELTIHLAAVLLTGTDGLLGPVQQLGLSPSNMLVNYNDINYDQPEI